MAFVLIDYHSFLRLLLTFLFLAFFFLFINNILFHHRTVAVSADRLLVLETVVAKGFIVFCAIQVLNLDNINFPLPLHNLVILTFRMLRVLRSARETKQH